jgi:hypothetical protein
LHQGWGNVEIPATTFVARIAGNPQALHVHPKEKISNVKKVLTLN